MKIFAALILVLLTACGSASLEQHKGTLPELKLETFFNGELVAYGMVLDRSGNLLRRFEVDLVASWQGDRGEISEWFRFNDGEKSTRIWALEKTGDNQYQGQAADVIGVAKGRTEGSALYWQYELEIDVDGTLYNVTLDDWMYLLDEKRLFNKTEMSKFGFKVGEIILYIEKK
ncbi:DUF3833 domain-containing protein [Vibrio sp. T187]|uniref:DUF3833 domain-containing protein n=1 Tax=Vibrio TaxID=662 RepID=UPI0010C9535F|nr:MULTISPECIES: DUF3833 domain-containing protein [Vibrio]MBW3696903.1 DUF3833 domain-containing protein [Vibrio sp. T187]